MILSHLCVSVDKAIKPVISSEHGQASRPDGDHTRAWLRTRYLGAFSGSSSAISSIDPSSSSSTVIESVFRSILTDKALVVFEGLNRNFCGEKMVRGSTSLKLYAKIGYVTGKRFRD
jgi:hypothetical protein